MNIQLFEIYFVCLSYFNDEKFSLRLLSHSLTDLENDEEVCFSSSSCRS